MLTFLNKKIPFNFGFTNQLVIALVLGCILALIMIFLGPFDTDRFQSSYKHLILGGFGVLLSIFYLVNSRIETWWYHYQNRKWTIKFEIIAFISLVIITSIPIHFYNQIFLNDFFSQGYGANEYIRHGLWFFRSSMIPIMLALLPFFIYFRNTFGQLDTSDSLKEIELFGTNRGEKINIQKHKLLFVKSSENYVEIFYEKENSVHHAIFRNTLTAINEQAPFLSYCHRSYLVNTSSIKQIRGNSQNAKIEFRHNLQIPLSKTYYKKVKSSLSV
ncbi:LytTR family transcriptional regulator DNA-binding domain-containing protein [Ulvibacterium sp.]|uniref:LytTR family transcriptional regulator DNA-binding domain-containing protein n=1 Tax=Ulvibacterium sp. TaxID=2665914 RepID=UPI00260495C2|nr:LytTR family transcriptional regulator DNA-binding domain-containing protein [Ulvibacterium sp.]